MKSISIFIFLIVILCQASGQKQENIDSYQSSAIKFQYDTIAKTLVTSSVVEIVGKPKSDIFNSIHNFLDEKYIKTGKYLIDSKETGRIVCEDTFPDIGYSIFSFDGKVLYNIVHKLVIDVKDGKYRTELTILKLKRGRVNDLGIVCGDVNDDLFIKEFYPYRKNSISKDRDLKTLGAALKYTIDFLDKVKIAVDNKSNW